MKVSKQEVLDLVRAYYMQTGATQEETIQGLGEIADCATSFQQAVIGEIKAQG